MRVVLLGAVLIVIAATASAAPPVARDAIYSVGGQTLFVRVLGDDGPVVVFEAGLGNGIASWGAVPDEVARFARVVLYERAGIGRSVPLARPGVPVTAAAVAGALHALLHAAGLRPPFILVGHSLGGLYVQMFARRYPAEVAGVVLLDASSPDAPAALKTRARLEPGSAAYLEEEGIAASNRQVTQAGPFPPVPLTVIAATDHGPYFRAWEPELMRLQVQLSQLSPEARLVLATGSGHDVQADRPAAVVAAVRETVQAAGWR